MGVATATACPALHRCIAAAREGLPISTSASDRSPGSSPAVAPSKPRLPKTLGPGLITGASDDDPSGIGTYSQAGEITSSAEAARALEPVAGHAAALVFALGIVGTGLLAVPVLAGSAAYAIGEARRWPVGLARQPREARAFYVTLGLATLLGMALNFTPVNPIGALYWAAIVNGVVAVPVMVVLMRMGCSRKVMGEFVVQGALRWLGWIATALMALAALAMIGSWLV